MSETHQVVAKTPRKQSDTAAKSTAPELVPELHEGEIPLILPLATREPSTLATQVNRLTHSPLPTAQRQAALSQLGRISGNHRLQTVLTTPSDSVQRRRIRDTGPEEADLPRDSPAVESPTATPTTEAPTETPTETPAREDEGTETRPPAIEEPLEATYMTHRFIGYTVDTGEMSQLSQSLQRMLRRGVTGEALEREQDAAAERGNRVIQQVRTGRAEDGTETRVNLYYEEVRHSEAVTAEQSLVVNGVAIPVRDATADELTAIQAALVHAPAPHLTELVNRRNRIVVVDWSGSRAESIPTHRLTGGTNIERSISSGERRHQSAAAETGLRIEITHTALSEGDRGMDTILHELGHVVYDANLIPRTVSRTYGSSVHAGASEQPAYGYMYYITNPARLAAGDRQAFAAAFTRQGLEPR